MGNQITVAPALPSGGAVWLLIDIDGVLNLDVSNSKSRTLGLTRTRVRSWRTGWSYTLHLQTWLGEAVRELAPLLQPAWCTTWFAEVDHPGRPGPISLVTRLGAGLPRVDLGYYVEDTRASKVDGIDQFFAEHPAPFVWIDDDPLASDRDRLAALAQKTSQPNLLIQTDPSVGVTHEQFEHAVQWARAL